MLRLTSFFCSILLAVAGASAQVTAITNVTLIHPGSGSIQPGTTVIVDGSIIRTVQPAAQPLPGGVRRVDGTGKFLIPGLQDSHVHLTKAGVDSLPLFIANGVTSVRDLGSDLAEVSQWRREIQSGKRIGPRITTSGQILESAANVARMKREATVEPVDRIRIPLANPAEGRKAVQRLKAAGADHIKMRSTPDAATLEAVVAESNRLGLPFAMHALASLDDMIRMRVGSVEHFAAVPPLDNMSADARRALFQKMAKAGVFLSTTVINIDGSILIGYEDAKRRLDDKQATIDPRRKFVCGYLAEDWREQVEERKGGAYDDFVKLLPGLYRDIREMREAGVRIVAGTDIGVVFIYPGFSLHDELAKLVEHTGSTPMQALEAATSNAALFHHASKRFGSIAPGQSADLVLLDADPAADIRNTSRIRGVMAQGRWFDRAALDGLLGTGAKACSH